MIREWRYDPRIEEQAFRDVTNPIVLAAVRAWIESAPRRPFFLFIHLWDVHHDYIPPPPYDALFREGTTARPGDGSREDLISRYDGEIRWTDATLAAIFEALDRRGLKDRSILLVTADHGEAFFEHGHHGHRFTLHDEEVRVPLLVRYPGRLPAGLCIEPPVSLIDIAPTLLDLAGLPPLPAALGRSLVPLLEAAGTSATWKERPAISEFRDHRQMLALRLERWKLIADLTSGTVQVYDLERDPGEHSPLGAADPSVPAAALAAHWERTVRQLDAAAARLPVPQTRDWTGLPEVHRRHLRSLGYLR
ncbi:MAG: sulfatase-like hydrolase/transferase [Planctomycetes bacterium]|nr:sulfatase-like hydrolase/transferase [Planctomycetota bacterium]